MVESQSPETVNKSTYKSGQIHRIQIKYLILKGIFFRSFSTQSTQLTQYVVFLSFYPSTYWRFFFYC